MFYTKGGNHRNEYGAFSSSLILKNFYFIAKVLFVLFGQCIFIS